MNPLQQIEQQTLDEGREWTRRLLQDRLQAAVDQIGPVSPVSGLTLKRARRVGMKLHAVCGVLELKLWYGFCTQSDRHMSPAREQWGLAPNQRFSPEFEKRMCYTATQTDSYEKAAAMAACWGSTVSDDGVHACVQRRGRQASAQTPPAPKRDRDETTMIIMMDGWMARHRGPQWGMKPPEKRVDRVHWHEIKSAVIFRLNQRVQTSSGRRILIKKHAVAVPAETEPTEFASQVHAEAMRLGLSAAKQVYVVQDGAIWLWNVFEDRFSSCASGTLDFYHASDHLWALANDLFGQGSPEATHWVRPLLHQLRHGKESRVLRSLAALVQSAHENHPQSLDIITNTENYFRRHEDHIHYAALGEAGVPIGSGAVESQCSQFQDRFKRTGQFWSDQGFANLLAVDLRVRNHELEHLWAA